MMAPRIEPMMPTVWNLWGAILWYSIRFHKNPPTKDPTTPSRIVPKKPIRSRPGTSSRATAAAVSDFIDAKITALDVPHGRKRIDGWKRLLSPAQLAEIDKVAGQQLRRVGYGN